MADAPKNTRRGIEIRNDLKQVADERPPINDFKSSLILPEWKVGVPSGKWSLKTAGQGRKFENTDVAPNGTFNRAVFDYADRSFTTREYGFEVPFNKTEALILDNYVDLELDSAEVAKDTILINREKRVSQALFNTTTFNGADYSLTVTNPWTGNLSEIQENVRFGAKKIRKRFGIHQKLLSLILNSDTIDYIIDELATDTTIVYTIALKDMSRDAQLAFLTNYLKVREIIEVLSLYDVTNMANTGESDFVSMWDETKAMLIYRSNGGVTHGAGIGRQPVWVKYSPDYIMESYDVEESNSKVVRAREYRGISIIKEYGFLFNDVKA